MPHIILKGISESGVTAHKLAPKLDEGDILLCKKFAVSRKEDYNSLEEKIRNCANEVLKELISNLNFYWDNARPQVGGEWWEAPTDEQRTIYPDTPENEKDKIIRAFGKNYVIFKGERKCL